VVSTEGTVTSRQVCMI